jgi:type IV fimbrial biogenesis protein FimT
MRRSSAGFTLIELLFVVTLIGIMIAIAVPSFASFIANYRATSAVNDLLEAITLTRTEALKRGRRVTLLPNTASNVPSATGSWTNGWTIFVDLDNNQTLNGADVFITKHEALPASISATPSDSASAPFSGANYVIFDGAGYPRTTTGATLSGGIVFVDHTGGTNNYRTLCLGVFGRPRVIKSVNAPSLCGASG